ncbi:unnamed protein product [Trichogramma brassicae]|uniref:Uncharacterized protein n=1 Tax=Trichogramma brassicae TaxID=86971 RepID=A0A6H5IWM1_9HYME|nr:unnamed protein product [Trichogramma brassicae]
MVQRKKNRQSDISPEMIPGPAGDAVNSNSIEEFWSCLFNKAMIDMLVEYTNEKIEQEKFYRTMTNSNDSFLDEDSFFTEIMSSQSNVEDQVVLLKISFCKKFIDETGRLAAMSSGMDNKTLTELWKRFGKMASTYNLEIKRTASDTVTSHFKSLCNNIVTILASNLDESDANIVSELYARLLCHQEPCIRQESYESFENLTQANENSNLLSTLAANIRNISPEAAKSLPEFLSSKVVDQSCSFNAVDKFYEALCESMKKWRHICYKRDQVDQKEKLQKLNYDEERKEEIEVEYVLPTLPLGRSRRRCKSRVLVLIRGFSSNILFPSSLESIRSRQWTSAPWPVVSPRQAIMSPR